MKKIYMILIVIYAIKSVQAQVINKGDFYVANNTMVSVYDNTINNDGSELVNNGDLYFFKDLANNGNITFTSNNNISGVYFVGDEQQIISGSGLTNVFDIEFNNSTSSFAFSLEKELIIHGTLLFQNGVIHNTTQGVLSFQSNSDYENLNNQSYANNKARKKGNSAFIFPVGDYKLDTFISRPLEISASDNINNQFLVTFNWSNSDVDFSHNSKEPSIGLIDMNEFWEINREIGNFDVSVTLTWNNITTPDFIRSNPTDIIIVRWNGFKWVNEGGVVDVGNSKITSNVSEYGIFTLASKSNIEVARVANMSDSFSPNGDGINDTFEILGLVDSYPNFKMKVYDKYGKLLFNYRNNGNLSPNWWDGTLEGKEMPVATYWYVIDYNDSKTKAYQGWLYLNK
ncbi:gliding motility-associated C-terminal domain-containing protein [Tenacibaculum soleae]|uniref:gliding motility-associated C-terminal domain-containing protein n=1 Tax=Tenacibaculum soleae TaxID=447689 RepID=UPI0026E35BA7|nr:gliding motility-associated C-terminal domain-containing protein [Tenacibaculum soleae]MDO6745533.1 gliding motility-associated C-terminal domain-containing protein [Tenacibaculum soleae]